MHGEGQTRKHTYHTQTSQHVYWIYLGANSVKRVSNSCNFSNTLFDLKSPVNADPVADEGDRQMAET